MGCCSSALWGYNRPAALTRSPYIIEISDRFIFAFHCGWGAYSQTYCPSFDGQEDLHATERNWSIWHGICDAFLVLRADFEGPPECLLCRERIHSRTWLRMKMVFTVYIPKNFARAEDSAKRENSQSSTAQSAAQSPCIVHCPHFALQIGHSCPGQQRTTARCIWPWCGQGPCKIGRAGGQGGGGRRMPRFTESGNATELAV